MLGTQYKMEPRIRHTGFLPVHYRKSNGTKVKGESHGNMPIKGFKHIAVKGLANSSAQHSHTRPISVNNMLLTNPGANTDGLL